MITLKKKTLKKSKSKKTIRKEGRERETWKTAEVGVTKEKEDWTPPEESEERAVWTSFLWRSKVDPAEASRSPDRDLPVHSSPEFLHTNVNTPISKSINQSNNSIFQRETVCVCVCIWRLRLYKNPRTGFYIERI